MSTISQNLIIEELKQEYVDDLTTLKKFIEEEFERDFSNETYRHVSVDLYDFLKSENESLLWSKEFYKDFSDENRISFLRRELKRLRILKMMCEENATLQNAN